MKRIAAIVVLLALVGPLAPAHAERAPLMLAAAGELSLEAAASKVRRAHGGRVVSATVDNRGNRPGYRIRLLQSDGRVLTFWVDARSGAARRAG